MRGGTGIEKKMAAIGDVMGTRDMRRDGGETPLRVIDTAHLR
jgi:hypothetical protein